jgi:hypothetical protein
VQWTEERRGGTSKKVEKAEYCDYFGGILSGKIDYPLIECGLVMYGLYQC